MLHRPRPSRSRARGEKAESLRRHAQKRVFQRYKFDGYGPEIVASVKKCITSSQSVCVLRQSRSRVHHLVVIEGKVVPVVYDSARHEVVTFLPQSALAGYALTEDDRQRLQLLGQK